MKDLDQWQELDNVKARGYELAEPAELTNRFIKRNAGPNRQARRAAASKARKADK